MWRQVLQLVSVILYSVLAELLPMVSMSYRQNANNMHNQIGMINFVYLYYLGVVVLCCQKKSSFSVLAFDDNRSVFGCVYKHSSLLQQKLKAFYLPVFSSRQ